MFIYLYICIFIYLYVSCSRLEQKLSKISKILKLQNTLQIRCCVFLAQKNLESAGSLGWALAGSNMK
jgi:hypothetical protein